VKPPLTHQLPCPQEDRVLHLAVQDPSNPWLATHGSSCEGCAELIELTRCVGMLHEPAAEEAPLPSAGQIWWKARLAARRAAEERVLRPVRVAESAGMAVTVMAALAGLAGIYRGIPVILSGLEHVSSGSRALTDPRLLVTMGLATIIMALAVRRLLARG